MMQNTHLRKTDTIIEGINDLYVVIFAVVSSAIMLKFASENLGATIALCIGGFVVYRIGMYFENNREQMQIEQRVEWLFEIISEIENS